MKNKVSLFTKSWDKLPLEQLADLVKSLGFDGVELPVRDGYQVNPENVTTELSNANRIFNERGLEILSVAASIDPIIIESMGNCGIRNLRDMARINIKTGYFNSVEQFRDSILVHEKLLRDSKVMVVIQNHQNNMVGSALGLHHLLNDIPFDIAGACLDFAHCTLDGEPVEMAVDIIKDRIELVNFKSAYYHRLNTSDADEPQWQTLWASHRNSLYSWKEAYSALESIGYVGDICMPAEYGIAGRKGQIMGDEIIPLIKSDLAHLNKIRS